MKKRLNLVKLDKCGTQSHPRDPSSSPGGAVSIFLSGLLSLDKSILNLRYFTSGIFTWANLVTVLRVMLVPAIALALLSGRNREALVLFLVAGASDALDGFLARALKQKSLIGAILDPLADKFLLDTIYILCAWKGDLPTFLAVLVVSRDVLIVVGFLILYLLGTSLKVKPTLISKINTAIQIITAALVLAEAPSRILNPLFFITALLTGASGLHYLYLALKSFSRRSESLSSREP